LVEDRTCRFDAAKPGLDDTPLRRREHDVPDDPSGPGQDGKTPPLIADGTEEPPLRMFIIYAREDERWRRELRVTLADLEASGLLSVWHDQQILPGDPWDDTIKGNLLEAQIILPLLSRYLLASHYIRDVELKLAMELHDARKARVVPVILSKCDWTRTPLSKLQALPKDGRPVEEWRFKARAFMDIELGIRRTAMEM
jgi:hypothetical protein